ncbi:oligosaccharide flippase family protein [Halopseudomonas aestusnigri]|uniref:Membrane protein involved in the export of O-antigen and teichoic acid n=1 Tax=Halopseudomonas aestusnigri TaxID=857252 RepID=A0AAQ1JRG0_9GAMM|nr:oligosaccharide flippase family protein [Halopseudomonas aestusnigri]SEG69594.1 Membrane protein involved in the export of O-antigen and teichoic acid [Halopseudomonas aestusnigri]
MKALILRSALGTTIILGLRLVVQASSLLMLASMLGPEQFGIYAGAAALALLLGALSTFGTQFVLLSEVAKDYSRRQSVLAYAVPSTLILGGGLFVLFSLVVHWWLPVDGYSYLAVIYLGLAEVVLLPLILFPAMELLASGKVVRSQLLTLMPLGLRMFAVLALLFSEVGSSLYAVCLVYLIMSVACFFIVFFLFPNAWLGLKYWRIASFLELKMSSSYALTSLAAVGPGEMDKVLALKLLPLDLSGLYSAASRIVGAATLPAIALVLSVLPRLIRGEGREASMKMSLVNWLLCVALIFSVMLAGFFVIVSSFVEWAFGEAYGGLSDMLVWLCLAIPGLSLRKVAGNILIANGNPLARVCFELVGVVLLVLFSFFLVSTLGSGAFVFSVFLSESLMALGMVFYVKSYSFYRDL